MPDDANKLNLYYAWNEISRGRGSFRVVGLDFLAGQPEESSVGHRTLSVTRLMRRARRRLTAQRSLRPRGYHARYTRSDVLCRWLIEKVVMSLNARNSLLRGEDSFQNAVGPNWESALSPPNDPQSGQAQAQQSQCAGLRNGIRSTKVHIRDDFVDETWIAGAGENKCQRIGR